MNAQIWVCLALTSWPCAFALYFEKAKEVFRPPTSLRNNSYFGYSITYDEYNQKLIISAPRADNIGDVYDCDIYKTSCTKINRSNVTRETKSGLEKYTHDFWFGATVKAGRDFVMMCAPRHTKHTVRKSIDYKNPGFDAFVTWGRCYTRTKSSLIEKEPIQEAIRIQDSPSPMEATMDSFGWSIDVSSDDSVIVGGPGMFHGRAMIYQQHSNFPDLIRHRKETPQFNFGYAVAAGAFIHDSTSYAISSTYGFGEVLFYKSFSTYLMKLEKMVDTQVVGSMFGAVLCAAKMFGRRSDLLVGAPTYGTKFTYNLGAVYIYLAVRTKKSPKFHRRIVGQEPGSMFGSAIISVGDLNNDHRDEIAIGAPFENAGQGVVYLYSGADLIGSATEKTLKPLQKIKPEPSFGESFGMSLTPLLDYDKNGCNEIAIGSPYTDTVLVLRCMASVFVTTSATFPDVQGRGSETKFKFDVCLSVNYPTLPRVIQASIKTTVEMNHDYAKLDRTDTTGRFTFTTSLNDKQPKYCIKVPFTLPVEGKYETEIPYAISSELLNDPRDYSDFNSTRVILSDRSVLYIQDALWAAECAGSKICVPILKLTPHISFKNDLHPYVIGSSDTETLSITVHNSGEVAYASCVKVQITGVNVLKPGSCVREPFNEGDIDMSMTVKCEPSKPIWNGESMTTGEIQLEMTHLTNLYKSIKINTFLYDRCNGNVTQNRTFEIPVIADPGGIFAKGESDIGTFVNMTEEDIKENGKKLQHVYTINNIGPTNWVGLPVHVTLHLQPYISYLNDDNSSVIVYFSVSNTYTPCQIKSKNETVISFVCTVDSLVKKFAKILIPMFILPGTLEGLLDKDHNITITSSVQLEITDEEFRSESVTSILVLKEAMVPIETIIVAVIVGLCILIIIALILYRVGFLRRKRREELQNLKKSVKRQTILRRSTMPSQNRGSDDRRQIVGGMTEGDEHAETPNLSKRTTE